MLMRYVKYVITNRGLHEFLSYFRTDAIHSWRMKVCQKFQIPENEFLNADRVEREESLTVFATKNLQLLIFPHKSRRFMQSVYYQAILLSLIRLYRFRLF